MDHARQAHLTLLADGEGGLRVIMYFSAQCDEHGWHHLKKTADYQAVTRIYDPWEWLQDALLVTYDQGCCAAGWKPFTGGDMPEGCDWDDR